MSDRIVSWLEDLACQTATVSISLMLVLTALMWPALIVLCFAAAVAALT